MHPGSIPGSVEYLELIAARLCAQNKVEEKSLFKNVKHVLYVKKYQNVLTFWSRLTFMKRNSGCIGFFEK